MPLAYICGHVASRDEQQEAYAVWLLTRIATAIFALAAIEFLLRRTRPYSVFLDSNVLAAYANLLFFASYGRLLALWQSHGAGIALRSGTAAFAALALVTQFVTTSMGAFLCFAGGLGLITLIGAPRSRAFWKAALLVIAVSAISYSTVYSISGRPSPFSRVSAEIRTGGNATHSEGTFIKERSALYHSALAMIHDQPWHGSGPGTFKALYPKYRSPDDRSTSGDLVHNDYLQFLLEGGPILLFCLLGTLAAVIAAIVGSTRRFWRRTAALDGGDIQRLGIQIAVLTAFMHAFVNFIFYSLTLSLLIGLLLSQMSPPPKRTVDLGKVISPAASRALTGLVLLTLTLTLGLTGVFIRITSGQCSLKVCELLQQDGKRMAGFANVLTAIQPSWITGNEFLIKGHLASAAIALSSDPVNAAANAAAAASISSELVSRFPANYPQFAVLADIIEAYPDARAAIASGVPRDPLTLYRRTIDANPMFIYPRVRVADLQSKAGDDAAAWQTIFEGTRWWKLNVVSDGDRRLLLDTALPLAVRTRHCVDAREMAEGLKLLDPRHVLAGQVLDGIPEATAAGNSQDNCGLGFRPELPASSKASQTRGAPVTAS